MMRRVERPGRPSHVLGLEIVPDEVMVETAELKA